MKYKHVFSICAYKDSPYLERCIRSLKGQTWSSHIIICTSTPSRYILHIFKLLNLFLSFLS